MQRVYFKVKNTLQLQHGLGLRYDFSVVKKIRFEMTDTLI